MSTVIHLDQVRDSKNKKQSIRDFLSVAQKIQNREIDQNDSYNSINTIITNNTLTRDDMVTALEHNDTIFATDVRFFIVDLYDHIISMKQRQLYIAQILREENERN